jgi:hypothetical protein
VVVAVAVAVDATAGSPHQGAGHALHLQHMSGVLLNCTPACSEPRLFQAA